MNKFCSKTTLHAVNGALEYVNIAGWVLARNEKFACFAQIREAVQLLGSIKERLGLVTRSAPVRVFKNH